MPFELSAATAVLERTPETFRTLLAGLPTEWTETNEGGDSWSPFVIMGHLVHGERTDWISRAELILSQAQASSAARHLGGARSWAHRADRARDGKTVSRRRWTVARVSAGDGSLIYAEENGNGPTSLATQAARFPLAAGAARSESFNHWNESPESMARPSVVQALTERGFVS